MRTYFENGAHRDARGHSTTGSAHLSKR
jgi:hypothetical protein